MNELLSLSRMAHLRGANLPLIKRQNRSLVLRILLHHGPISRAEICHMTHLTPATVSNVIGELLQRGLAVELGSEERGGAPRLGRRRIMVDLNAHGSFVVGIHFGIRWLQVGLGDLRGRLLGKISVPSCGQDGPEAVFALVREQLDQLLADTQIPSRHVCGVGLGSIGVVDSATGEIIDLPQYGWRGVAAKARLEALLGMPVVVDSNRRAMATAEAWFGHSQGADSIMLVHVATTIGGAVVFKRDVLHGANYAAGQLGHLIVVEDGERCACGHRGCLDTVASDAAIVAQAASAAREGKSPELLELTNGRPEEMHLDHVFAAAEQGDHTARAIVARSAHYLGMGVAHYVSLFDPAVIVLTGGVALRGGEDYRRLVELAVNERVCGPSFGPVELVPASFGAETEVIGSLSLALRRFAYTAESSTLGYDGVRDAQEHRLRSGRSW